MTRFSVEESRQHEDNAFDFMVKTYKDDLLKILQPVKEKDHYSLAINYLQLANALPIVGSLLLESPGQVIPLLNIATKRAFDDVHKQEKGSAAVSSDFDKLKLHVRIHSLPICSNLYKLNFPSCKEVGKFMCLVGTVVRVTSAKVLEYAKTYECNKCNDKMIVKAIPSRYHSFPKFVKCQNLCARSRMTLVVTKNKNVRDYQEIRVQERTKSITLGMMPKAIPVILEDDIVNSVAPGDDVSIMGTLCLRWKPFRPGSPIESELVFRANSVQTNNDKKNNFCLTDEISGLENIFWEKRAKDPFMGRNIIVASFCPKIYGMYYVKLALCIVLAGGVTRTVSKTKIRGESHVLLVGDPGTGKSQLLKYASLMSSRSVLTTGVGTSSAGLTASAVKDNGEWHLEAGALVLADGGVCCIDEFSCIKEHDKTSIHEAMEQQCISIAKAGMVVNLPTRVTMVAATNPKLKLDSSDKTLSEIIGIASPLLSRFDILMVLMDTQDDDWDSSIADFILEGRDMFTEALKSANISPSDIWSTERLKTYFLRIKHLIPIWTTDASHVLGKYYQFERGLATENNASRTSVRMLESLRRLAEGHARLMYRDKVLLCDVISAISLMEISLGSSSSITGTSNNVLHTPFPVDPLLEYKHKAHGIFEKLNLTHIWVREQEYLNSISDQPS